MISARAMRDAAVLAALGAGLSGCSLFGGGGEDGPTIRGERVRVLDAEETLSADVEAAGRFVRLSEPRPMADWPQTLGRADHDPGHVALEAGRLRPVWRTDIGKGDARNARMVSAPIVAAGVVYAVDSKAQVTAVSAADGKALWSRRFVVEAEKPAAVGFGGGLAYGEGGLFYTSGFGHVARLDPQTGEEVWRTVLTAPARAAPTYSDGRVYAVSIDNRLVALDAGTGAELWNHQGLEETARLLLGASPAADEDVVIVAYGSGEIFALSADRGFVLWQDALALSGRLAAIAALNDIAASPVLTDGAVIAANRSGRLTAIDIRTGGRLWTRSVGSTSAPAVDGRFVFLITGDNELLCLDLDDGLIIWLLRLESEDDDKPAVWNGPVLAGGRLILASSDGYLVEVDPQTGELLRDVKTGAPVVRAPVVAGDTVYVLTEDARLRAYR